MTRNADAVEVADVQSLAVLPVGSRVVPFGYGDDAVTIKQHSGTFTSARLLPSPPHGFAGAATSRRG